MFVRPASIPQQVHRQAGKVVDQGQLNRGYQMSNLPKLLRGDANVRAGGELQVNRAATKRAEEAGQAGLGVRQFAGGETVCGSTPV